jgi:Ricin-type beta-trefoil lectin domain
MAFASGQAQAYETLQVNGGMALNVYPSDRQINGNPRVSLFPHSITDQDQQFTRFTNPDGSLRFQNRSTNKCLNAHTLSNGGELNVWPCDPNDADQKFDLVNVNMQAQSFQIRRRGTNLCVDSPTRDRLGRIHLWTCDASNRNPSQIWISNNAGGPETNNSDIVQRAKAWVDQGIRYNQSAWYQGYRQDCSGFISMAWRLPTSAVTGTLPQYSVTLRSKNELRPGDAINNRQAGNSGHVVMFVRWVDQNRGTFIAYEENGGAGRTVQKTLTLVPYGNQFNIPEYPGHAPWFLERKR